MRRSEPTDGTLEVTYWKSRGKDAGHDDTTCLATRTGVVSRPFETSMTSTVAPLIARTNEPSMMSPVAPLIAQTNDPGSSASDSTTRQRRVTCVTHHTHAREKKKHAHEWKRLFGGEAKFSFREAFCGRQDCEKESQQAALSTHVSSTDTLLRVRVYIRMTSPSRLALCSSPSLPSPREGTGCYIFLKSVFSLSTLPASPPRAIPKRTR